MLINNLQKHRHTYSVESRTEQAFYSSSSKLRPSIQKTQTRYASTIKSQKRLPVSEPRPPSTQHLQIKDQMISTNPGMSQLLQQPTKSITFDNNELTSSRRRLIFKTEHNFCSQEQSKKLAQQYLKPGSKVETLYKKSSKLESPYFRSPAVGLSRHSHLGQPEASQNPSRITKYIANAKPQVGMANNTEQKTQNTEKQQNASNYKSITVEKQKTQEIKQKQQSIFKDLKYHEVFFCAYCFRYIFGIEKTYHYPSCQNKVELSKLSGPQKYDLGMENLNILLELSSYINYKSQQVKAVWQNLTEHRKLPQFRDPLTARSYYQIGEMETAIQVIITRLIAPDWAARSGGTFFCNNVDHESRVYS